MRMKKYFPFLEWLPNYKQQNLRGDLSAGLTVGVMLIPQGMAYAMIAGLPPIYGLYASLVPILIYALFGTSRQLAVGPVAMVSLLIAAGVGKMAETGSANYIELALLLALMVGVIQFALGLFRLGFIVNFLSHPVLSGFTSAAALIIGLSQLKHLLGIEIPRSHFIHEIVINAFWDISETNLFTLGIGLGGIFTIILLKRLSKAIPGSLIAVAAGIAVVYFGGVFNNGVQIVGEVPSGLPAFTLPVIDGSALGELMPIALTIALVGFMESIAVAKAIQARHKSYKVDANQELIGLGLANIAGAFFRSFPTTGGFSRTAVNDGAGAKTGLSSIVSAVLIGLTLLFLTPLFYYLPNAILAAVIMVAVFGLIDYKEAVILWKSDRTEFVMLIATFLATLALGIEQGILTGVILSLGMVIYRSAYPHMAVLGKIPGTTHYRNINRFAEAVESKEVLIVRIDAQLYFANSQNFKDWVLSKIEQKGTGLKVLILSAQAINAVDSTAVHMLKDLLDELEKKDIRLVIAAAKGPVRDTLKKSGFTARVGEENFFMFVQDAVDAISTGEEVDKKYVLQTNTD